MLNNNQTIYGSKIIMEMLWDILMFPIWWYTKGIILTLGKLVTFLKNKEKGLGISIWFKNLLKPMYGQTDLAGKAISFLMRSVQIFFRSLIMLFWCFVALLSFCVWLILPILVSFEIIYQFV